MLSVRIVVAVGVLGAGLVPVLGQRQGEPAPPKPAAFVPKPPRNAASEYWRAWALAGGTSESPIRKVEWDKIGDNLDPARMPPEFSEAKKSLVVESLHVFERAGRAETCDFELDVSEGPGLLMPHLAAVRDLARAARVDARTKLMEGDGAGAAARIESMYRAARHLGRDGVMISALVAASIARSANDEAAVLARSGKLADDDRARLIAAIDALRAEDALGLLAALRMEREMTSRWIAREFTGPDGPARFAGEMRLMSGGDPETEKRYAEVARLSEHEFKEAVAKLDAFFEEAIAAWAAPDAKARIGELDAWAARGDFGAAVCWLAPALGKAYDARERVLKDLAETSAALEKRP